MAKRFTLKAIGLLSAIAFCAPAETEAEGESTAKKGDEPTLYMKHTGGWGTGVQAELTIHKEGSFRYQSKKKDLRGTIPSTEMYALIRHIASAGAGPAAEDAGYVQFKWIAQNGKTGSRNYSHPRKDPCHSVVKRIEVLVTKYGKKAAEQGNGR